MILHAGNIFAGIPDALSAEEFRRIVTTPSVRIERIVSRGQASPKDFWYDQPEAEWVIVLAGAAEIVVEGEPWPRRLGPGDYLHIPAHARHRVAWTSPDEATVWLAVHHR
jgi:cupin 2 domain-containing protein